MGKQQDREKIVQEIKVAADLYRKHLVGKRFLYVFEGCIFRKNCASVPEERSAIPLQTEQSSAG